jgi:curved DNA-binding protein CbpA
MSDPLDALDYYTLLQVAPDATADAVRAAFHQFALRYHPDSYTMASAEDRSRVNQIYRRGGEAYRVLSNASARAAYDAGLAEGKLRHAASGGSEREASRAQVAKRTVNAKARPFWAKAQAAIRDGQWGPAKLNLQIALGHDPEHPTLTERLAFVQAQTAR